MHLRSRLWRGSRSPSAGWWLMVFWVAAPSLAEPVVDQQYDISQSYGGSIVAASSGIRYELAQSFTVGLQGQLSAVGLELGRDAGTLGDIDVEIRDFNGSEPGSTVLAQQTIPIDSLPITGPGGSVPFTSVDLSTAGLLVNPGEQYAIVVSRDGTFSSPHAIWNYGPPVYSSGSSYDRFETQAWTAFGSVDYGFQTLIEQNPVDTQQLTLTPTFDVQADSDGLGGFTLSEGDNTLEAYQGASREARPVLEFPIDAIPDNATITSATLSVFVNVFTTSGGQNPAIDFGGYQGNGTPELADIAAGTTDLGSTGTITQSRVHEVSLSTGLLQSLLAQSDHLGVVGTAGTYGLQAAFGSSEYAALLNNPEWGPRLTVSFTTPDEPPPTPGDYNGNRVPDLADYTVWRNTLGSTTDLRADGNHNNIVDAGDYQAWRDAMTSLYPAGLENGDFETGDLEHWESFVTENGVVSSGYPRAELIDVTGDGNESYAMRIRGSQDNVDFSSPPAGGGIRQEFLLVSPGDYSLSMDIASTNEQEFGNTAPGLYELLFDGVIVDSLDLNGTTIGGFEIIRDSLAAALLGVEAGLHTVEIRFLRTGNNARPVYGHVDNLQLALLTAGQQTAAIPEPSSLAALTTLALASVALRGATKSVEPGV